jgi:hypothetical protein
MSEDDEEVELMISQRTAEYADLAQSFADKL